MQDSIQATQTNPAAVMDAPAPDRRLWKFALFFAVAALAFLSAPETANTVREALADAYIAVSTFVAATLTLFYFLEHSFKVDTERLLARNRRWHIPMAAFMGMIPGCGGAIVVMTQYVSGRLGFGSVVAVLTATMGDAAFLLLAREPATALMVYMICFVTGTLSGMLAERVLGRDYMRREIRSPSSANKVVPPEKTGLPGVLWLSLMAPGLALGIADAFQIDTDALLSTIITIPDAWSPTTWIGLCGSFLALFMWSMTRGAGPKNITGFFTPPENGETARAVLDRVIVSTNFVTVWVICAFLLFELGILWSGFDIETLFGTHIMLLPLLAVLIGCLPGCGPQILVTTLYLNGLIPLAALLANAISNDGDALFPAIAVAPKTAIIATLYGTVPALMVGYGWLFLFGG